MTTELALEWAGCIFGLGGALLLALQKPYSRWGWWLFLAANALMVLLALRLRLDGLLIQQLGFFITSIIGLRNAGFLKASAK